MSSRGIRRGISSSIVHSRRVLLQALGVWKRRVRLLLYRQSLPAIPLEDVQVQQSEPASSEPVSIPDNSSQSESLLTPDNVRQSEPWLEPKELSTIRRANTSDARCASWILRNITDPEALDAALPVAGEIRWFDDGFNADLPYDLIVSTFEGCFDSTRTLYPGSRDRAYYSGRAMAWIRTLAMCKSKEFASTFPLPAQEYTTSVSDPDLEHLLNAICGFWDPDYYIEWLLRIDPGYTHPHLQWISNLLLHHSWANRTKMNYEHLLVIFFRTRKTEITPLPLNMTLNRLLVWCTFLGSSVEGEALRVQVKSYDIPCFPSSNHSLLLTSDRIEHILNQLSNAILSSINDTDTRHNFIPYALDDLTKLEARPQSLIRMSYKWCSVICENRESFEDWERLLFLCLEIGFRHLAFRSRYIEIALTHTEHHRGLVDIVFKSRESEVIADLLCAWAVPSASYGLGVELLGTCAGHLVCLHDLISSSSRLRRLVIRSVELVGYGGFEGVGVERFVELLNHLHVTVEDMDYELRWATLLFDTVQSFEGAQHLSHSHWELLAELAVQRLFRSDRAHSLQTITSFLTRTEQWSKLECWMGIVWMLEADGMIEEDLDRSMVLLFRQRPGALYKLQQWMERWSKRNSKDIPESFERICKQAHEAAQRDAP